MTDGQTTQRAPREGSLEAPTRHPIDWQSAEFYDKEKLDAELERVFDICHGCRRCVSLCQSFPTLFDLVDESDTMEVDGVAKEDFMKVVDHCYLCDLCYMTKCPYVPPHEWNVDFPHLMLRAKAYRFKQQGASFRDRTLTDTDKVGKLASIPIIVQTVNSMNRNSAFRKTLESSFGVHHAAPVPTYHSNTLRKRMASQTKAIEPKPVNGTTGKVALYATCYGNYNIPEVGEDFYTVFQHNDIHIELVPKEQCCGMPKMELGDLEAVKRAKEANIPVLARLVDEGYDLMAPVPSCVLMYKQEIPLMFPDDADVQKVKNAFFDPFEYLFLRHKGGMLKTDFKQSLGNVGYQVACHQRVQNIGMKTRDILSMVPDTTVHPQERCSGHDGTYAVKKETHEFADKIGRPVARKIDDLKPEHLTSDCPMAATQIANLSKTMDQAEHPITLLRKAYGLL
jgi:glycerol-3-phosphate dehydrogenase subunit C